MKFDKVAENTRDLKSHWFDYSVVADSPWFEIFLQRMLS